MGAWILCIVIGAISISAIYVKAAFSHRHTPLLSQKDLKEAVRRKKEEEKKTLDL